MLSESQHQLERWRVFVVVLAEELSGSDDGLFAELFGDISDDDRLVTAEASRRSSIKRAVKIIVARQIAVFCGQKRNTVIYKPPVAV